MGKPLIKRVVDNILVERDKYRCDGDNLIVLSFQSKEVVDIIMTEGIYRAVPELSREKNDYISDIKNLNGEYPVWGFSLDGNQGLGQFYDGKIFNHYLYEMSIPADSFKDLYLIELRVPLDLVREGITNCFSEQAKVFPYISKEMVVGIHACFNCLVYNDKEASPLRESTSYFKRVLDLGNYSEQDSMFPNQFFSLTAEEINLVKPNIDFLTLPLKNHALKNREIIETNIEKMENGFTKTSFSVVEVVHPVDAERPIPSISSNPLD